MKSKTTYTARVDSTYVNWNGDLELRIDNSDSIEAQLDFKTLKTLHKQLGDRIKKLEDEQLEEARQRLEKVNDE